MNVVWADSNVLLRFLTKEPPALWRRAAALMREAESGSVLLHIPVVVISEVAAALRHSFGRRLDHIAAALTVVVDAPGVDAEDSNAVREALGAMVRLKVDFVDAYLAVKARDARAPIASFDSDLAKKLGAEIFPL